MDEFFAMRNDADRPHPLDKATYIINALNIIWHFSAGLPMLHFTMDYSADLNDKVGFDALCRAVHTTILGTGLF